MDNGDNSLEVRELQEKRESLARLAGAFRDCAEDIRTGKVKPPTPTRFDRCIDEANKCLDEIEAINLKLAILVPGSDKVVHLKRRELSLGDAREPVDNVLTVE